MSDVTRILSQIGSLARSAATDVAYTTVAIPTAATCLPAAPIAARQAAWSDFPEIMPTASAANTVSPAPQTSRTSVGVAGGCQMDHYPTEVLTTAATCDICFVPAVASTAASFPVA